MGNCKCSSRRRGTVKKNLRKLLKRILPLSPFESRVSKGTFLLLLYILFILRHAKNPQPSILPSFVASSLSSGGRSAHILPYTYSTHIHVCTDTPRDPAQTWFMHFSPNERRGGRKRREEKWICQPEENRILYSYSQLEVEVSLFHKNPPPPLRYCRAIAKAAQYSATEGRHCRKSQKYLHTQSYTALSLSQCKFLCKNQLT